MSADWAGARAAAEAIASGWAGQPGGAFALFDVDGLRETACGGLASLEFGVPFTADTPSRYASISKHVLATALLLEGVEIEQPLGALLPDLPPAFAAVPLGRALDMTGGLPDAMELLWQQGAAFTTTISSEQIMAALRRVDALGTPPGAEMAYSNTGWRLGQAALERATGRPYAALLQERLFGPVQLPITFPYDETEPVPGLATGYWRDGARWRRGRHGPHISASGGLAGSAASLSGWAAALLAGRGQLSGVLDRLRAPRRFADGAPSAYRLGLVETRLFGQAILAHSGALPGYRNHLLIAPEAGVGVALLLNRDEDPMLPALRVMAALLGAAAPEPARLQPGLYAEEAGTAWAQLHPDALEFMGGRETLLPDAAGFRSVPSTLEMDLRIGPDAIEGRIGGVARRLLRVPDSTAFDPRLAGRWHDQDFGAELLIRADGTARWPALGGVGQEIALTPLPGARAVASVPHLMWTHRPCLVLDGDTLHVASHRCRVLRYRRA